MLWIDTKLVLGDKNGGDQLKKIEISPIIGISPLSCQ